ncbi:uncharacterized protein KY384_005126 [Bacidia gigantensis]|uniref:uncharacterized protein n=1 Tax=Bacidia gigantensis TaxID=2732470 RepID=UPI001D04DBB0|nr:uncharacterized protein KY384_005126 [Bacidia gigantensis]KAG8529645.1 hypothetical protein KY384_005126 [Bacidia gigantensis]
MDPAENIIGYVDPLICSPGDKAEVKVSCYQPTFESEVFRLGAGYKHENAPPVSHRRVESIPKQRHVGNSQLSKTGSFLRIPSWNWSTTAGVDSISIEFWCQPTLPTGAGHHQYLFSVYHSVSNDSASCDGVYCCLDNSGSLRLGADYANIANPAKFSLKFVSYQWYHLHFTIEPKKSLVTLRSKITAKDIGEETSVTSEEHELWMPILKTSERPLIIAGYESRKRRASLNDNHGSFNGKIDGFKLETMVDGSTDVLLDLDFSIDISTNKVRDKSKYKHDGELINAPSRAVTGHDWDASQVDWTKAKYGYGAIHFHDDDLDDAMWETSFTLDIPNDIPSGCYGVSVSDGKSSDMIPFFVRPNPLAAQNPPVALIIPTFTYAELCSDIGLAYANEHLHDETRTVHFPGDTSKLDKYSRILKARGDLGISLYDSHNDGSGTTSSSLKRPVLNMRPDYKMWLFDGPRELAADLWFISFLDRELSTPSNQSRPPYDTITDHDISAQGSSLLNKYKVLLSCSHPEYPTSSMLDAYATFLAHGGHFMYLGGNGYYWSTTHSSTSSPHRIEVRRAEAGCRTFQLPPGEHHHPLTGERGGLWRSRGRPPNQLFGIGSCAMGVGKGAAYGITPAARNDPPLVHILKGIEKDVIGDYGLVNGAASGDEIDRLDYGLGTPKNAVIVATTKLAGGHSDDYMLFNEEVLYPMVNLKGTESEKVRSDVVFFDTPSGGAVFSVGSINWVGAMAWHDYDNDVARLTANVLHEFLRRSGERG